MGRTAGLSLMLFCGIMAPGQEPEGLLDRFLSNIRAELTRLPQYVCTQSIERFSRPGPDRAWERVDVLRLEVAMAGEKEMYARAGAARFDERPLAELVGRGTVGTGQLGAIARHVFLSSKGRFTWRAETERNGRPAHQYDYDIPAESSSYRLRSGTEEAVVAFHGAFWIDAGNLDLIGIDLQAYDLPERLGVAEAETLLSYSRVPVGPAEILIPVAATLRIAGTDGLESMNRAQLVQCRQFQSESVLRFDDTEPAPTGNTVPFAIPVASVLEIEMDTALRPEKAQLGDVVTARVSRPLKEGERIIIPEGAVVKAHIVRLEKESIPFEMYEIGIDLESISVDAQDHPLDATMIEAGPAPGLIPQAKRLDPKFTRRRKARFDILVREVQKGQGILHWDARRGAIPKGLRMKWRVAGESTKSGHE